MGVGGVTSTDLERELIFESDWVTFVEGWSDRARGIVSMSMSVSIVVVKEGKENGGKTR